MIVVISPAKTLDFNNKNENLPVTKPIFIKDAKTLIKELRTYNINSISELMKISDNLAKLNVERYKYWTDSMVNTKQSITAFKGDVYVGMDVGSFNIEELFYTNEHLRILSGLYGVLKPFDGINEYRLEMGIRLKVGIHKNLYEYWGNRLIYNIVKDLKNSNNILINLASKEYFKSIEKIKDFKEIKIITPIFKEEKNGEYKVISFKAKRARGLMTAYIMKNQIETIDQLKNFNYEGYKFNEELSEGNNLIFTRDKKYEIDI